MGFRLVSWRELSPTDPPRPDNLHFLRMSSSLSSGPAPALLASLVFAALLVAGLLFRVWLLSRQIRHVARHRSEVPAAFAGRIGLDAHQRAADYTMAGARLAIIETAFAGAITVSWTLLGGLDQLNGWTSTLVSGALSQQLALLATFMVIQALIDLPWAAYRTFSLEQRFGFNRTRPSLWLADLARSAVVSAILGLPIAALILWLMGRAGPYWWFWAWLSWVGFNLTLLWVYPQFIAPLFNRFEPLENQDLKDRVTRLMARCGFRSNGFFVMDGSRRSAHANAYFTGLGTSKRVVFYDTLLKQLAPAQVEAVLAHELGHFRHRHVVKRLIAVFAASLVALALIGWLSGRSWFYVGLGVTPNFGPPLTAPNDALALLLFALAAPIFLGWLAPLSSWLSRRQEFEADAFAVAHADGAELARALVALYQDNASTLTPDPVYASVYYSHPPAAERISRLPA